eukprot:g554.t1
MRIFGTTTALRPLLVPKRKTQIRRYSRTPSIHYCCYLGSRFRLVFPKGVHLNATRRGSKSPRIAVLCQVGRSSDHFFKPNDDSNDDESFTKDEMKLIGAISTLEPYERTEILPNVSVEAMDAIQKTASGMLGMLPPTQFQIQIQALRDPLANLVFSSLCTGYALRNAEYRLHLQDSLNEGQDENDVNINIALDERIRASLPKAAVDYIKNIELQLQSYRDKEVLAELEAESSAPGGANRLLQYVRGMHPDSVNKLSESAGRGVVHAFNLTVKKVVENLHLTQAYPSSAKLLGRLRSALGETEKQKSASIGSSFTSTSFNISRDNLTDALLWSMLVGYYTKNLECRLALEKCVQDEVSDFESDLDKAWYLKLGSLFQDDQ